MGQRLGDSYHAYQHTIGDIERITKKIASKLDLDRATEVWIFIINVDDLELTQLAYPQRPRSHARSKPKKGQRKIRIS